MIPNDLKSRRRAARPAKIIAAILLTAFLLVSVSPWLLPLINR